MEKSNYNPGNYLKTSDPNFIPILKDALAGDESALQRPEIKALNVNNLKKAIEWLATRDDGVSQDVKKVLSSEGWRLTYFRKPPTPEEFLEWDWIGPQSESIWPNVRKAFIEYMDPNPLNCKRGIALSTSIGWGKSLLANLILAYIVVLFGLMRQPYRLLGHSPMTSYCVALCSFTQNKAWDLLGTPFEQFLEQSPYFEKVGRHDDITAINKEDMECQKCYYTTAARGSSKMLFRNNLSLSIISTEGGLLGKAQPLYSKIMLPDGTYKTMGEIKLGDKIASPTEGETEVVGVFPQGKRRIYEIELEDGKKTRAADNHLWKVAINKKEDQSWDWQIVDTLQLIQWLEDGIEIEIYGEDNDPNCHIPK